QHQRTLVGDVLRRACPDSIVPVVGRWRRPRARVPTGRYRSGQLAFGLLGRRRLPPVHQPEDSLPIHRRHAHRAAAVLERESGPGGAFAESGEIGRTNPLSLVAGAHPEAGAGAADAGMVRSGPILHVSTYKTWEQVGRYYWGLVRDQLTPNEEIRRAVEKAL